MDILTVDAVGKHFGDRRALSSASVRVAEGRVQAMVGRNGAGKSTLLRIGAGLIAPDYGLVIWRGVRRQRSHLDQLARDGLLFLPADGLLAPNRRLGEQLQLFADVFGRGSANDAARTVAEVLCATRLESFASRCILELSGGERRRADLAVALLRRPDCLLADEIFRDLAPIDCEWMGNTLRQLAAQECAVLVTGHEVPFLLRFADDITWCTDGTTYSLGSPEQAGRHDAFRASYLGIPHDAAATRRPSA